jgi:hypothetical protein
LARPLGKSESLGSILRPCMWHSARSTATIAGSDINPGMFAQNACVEIGRKPGENFLDVFGLKNATRPLMPEGVPTLVEGCLEARKTRRGTRRGRLRVGMFATVNLSHDPGTGPAHRGPIGDDLSRYLATATT